MSLYEVKDVTVPGLHTYLSVTRTLIVRKPRILL